MKNLMYSNWLWFSIAIIVTLIIIWCVAKYIKSYPSEDTYYFSVTDVEGVVSCIHDSGIKPSQTPPSSIISLQILKSEYNNGKKTDISTPLIIRLGNHPKNLKWSISPMSIDENDIYYIVKLQSPKENMFHNLI